MRDVKSVDLSCRQVAICQNFYRTNFCPNFWGQISIKKQQMYVGT
jgi:hypothetical protein